MTNLISGAGFIGIFVSVPLAFGAPAAIDVLVGSFAALFYAFTTTVD